MHQCKQDDSFDLELGASASGVTGSGSHPGGGHHNHRKSSRNSSRQNSSRRYSGRTFIKNLGLTLICNDLQQTFKVFYNYFKK